MTSQYDPRQEFDYNPEDFLPPPPPDAEVIPQNPVGYGPEPPISYSTNMPETAKKWGQAGNKYTYLAESPAAMKIAQDLGAPDIYKGYRDEGLPKPSPFGPSGVGPEPKAGELDRMQAQRSGWKAHVDEHYGGTDPMLINPEEEAQKARKAQERKEAVDFIKGDPTKSDYKAAEKRVKEAGDNAGKAAEWKLKSAQEDHKGFQHYFDQQFTELQSRKREQFTELQSRLSEERKIASEERRQKGLDTLANVDKAQKYTMAQMEGERAPWNFELSQDELNAAIKDPTLPLTGKRLKPMVLTNINRERERAGLPPIVEKKLPDMKETTTFWPGGPEIPFTGEKKTKQYGYEEGAAPAPRSASVPRGNGGAAAPASQVVRTGTHNGRRVVQFADGRTEYAR